MRGLNPDFNNGQSGVNGNGDKGDGGNNDRGGGESGKDSGSGNGVSGSGPQAVAAGDMSGILRTLREIKEEVVLKNEVPHPNQTYEHKNIQLLREILENNDFSQRYIEKIVGNLKKTFTLDDLNDEEYVKNAVRRMICDSISIFEEREGARPRIFVLVGPTGVGKTTTIGKIASGYLPQIVEKNRSPHSVSRVAKQTAIFSIDQLKVGAGAQLEVYSKHTPIHVNTDIHDELQLKDAITKQSETADIIFIDTYGKSQRDKAKLAEMKQWLSVCGEAAEYHLAVSAGAKRADIREIFKQFEIFPYRSVIVTKLDETSGLGGVISVAEEERKCFSFVTFGQVIPLDIERANADIFLSHISGLNNV
jgi:flagellar biosynthesis protein FlhF